jgi:5-methylcytosine-specific restriction endonuclease McrA
MYRCIVLNGDFTFLNTISWKRAVCLIIKGKAEALKYADKTIRCSDGTEMKLPIVMKLIKVIRMIYKNRVPYSKKNIMTRDNYTCAYCGSNEELTIDHIIPICQGGKSTFENCVTACFSCNNAKNNRTPNQAKMYLHKKAYAPTISEFFVMKMKNLGLDSFLKELGLY